MRKLLLASAMSLGLAGTAVAVPITGSISINGLNQYSASVMDFIGTGNVGAGTASGSYSPAFLAGCAGCVTLTDFIYNILGAHAPVTVYSATIGADTAEFSLDNIVSYSNGGGFLNISATGIATLTGYDATLGTIAISSQGPQNTVVTFSATSTAVPEPISLALLGTGLLGLGLARRATKPTA